MIGARRTRVASVRTKRIEKKRAKRVQVFDVLIGRAQQRVASLRFCCTCGFACKYAFKLESLMNVPWRYAWNMRMHQALHGLVLANAEAANRSACTIASNPHLCTRYRWLRGS